MVQIELIETLYGTSASESFDILKVKRGKADYTIAAYNRGNGYVKLFYMQDFFDWYVLDEKAEPIADMTLDEYDDGDTLINILDEILK